MIKILFVCHGNICRSPMAEFVLKDMVKKKGVEKLFYIASAATSTEEIGNTVHPGTQTVLEKLSISTKGKRAIQMTKKDYEEYDYIVAMDSWNIKNIYRIIGEDSLSKVQRLLDYTHNPRDIADPWYTRDFDRTYQEVYEGCEFLLNMICAQNNITLH